MYCYRWKYIVYKVVNSSFMSTSYNINVIKCLFSFGRLNFTSIYLKHLPAVSVFFQVWQWVDSGSGGSWQWERAKGQSLSGNRSSGGWNIHPAPQPTGVFVLICALYMNVYTKPWGKQLGPCDEASRITDCRFGLMSRERKIASTSLVH